MDRGAIWHHSRGFKEGQGGNLLLAATGAVYGRVDGLIIPLTAYHNVVDNIINLLTALKISVNSIVGNAVDSINYIC